MSGGYDKQCPECKGLRVVKVIDRAVLSADQDKVLAMLDKQAQEDAEYAALCAWERRTGC